MSNNRTPVKRWSKKNCGSCKWFVKIAGNFGGGLCEDSDARTKSDYGNNCKTWKAKKYRRKKWTNRNWRH